MTLKIWVRVEIHHMTHPLNSMVFCQKIPTQHAYAWQIGPFWQYTLVMFVPNMEGFRRNTFRNAQAVRQTCKMDNIFAVNCKIIVESPWRYRSRLKVITGNTLSRASDHFCQIHESTQNCRHYRADTRDQKVTTNIQIDRQTHTDRQTDRQIDRQGESNIPTPLFCCHGFDKSCHSWNCTGIPMIKEPVWILHNVSCHLIS